MRLSFFPNSPPPKPSFYNNTDSTHRDRSQTLTQNYARLGLTSRLGNATGGVEVKAKQDKKIGSQDDDDDDDDEHSLENAADSLAIYNSGSMAA